MSERLELFLKMNLNNAFKLRKITEVENIYHSSDSTLYFVIFQVSN